jgi:hypothetical protein
MSKIPKIIGAVLLALGITGICVTNFASASLIVAVGVRTLSVLKLACIIAAGAGAATLIGGFVPDVLHLIANTGFQKRIEGANAERRKTFAEYAKDSLNPVKTRERLEDLKENNPNLAQLVDRCLMQMGKMDKLQARYAALLSANDATYLDNTVSVIDDAETRMCRNMRNIINCCILVEDGSDDLSDFDNQIISKSLQDNENELQNVDTLIHYAVNYINNYQQNGVTDMSELKAWIKVMRQSTEDSSHEIR